MGTKQSEAILNAYAALPRDRSGMAKGNWGKAIAGALEIKRAVVEKVVYGELSRIRKEAGLKVFIHRHEVAAYNKVFFPAVKASFDARREAAR